MWICSSTALLCVASLFHYDHETPPPKKAFSTCLCLIYTNIQTFIMLQKISINLLKLLN